MASDLLTKEEQNFIRFSKACDDVMPLPLRDILDWQIHPKDLHQKIKSCYILTYGKEKLNSYQLDMCHPCQKILTDYSNFDVTLLYKLIRNLCPGLKPTKQWGMEPDCNATQIGDDIERIRVFRNTIGHPRLSNISDSDFQICWRDLKIVIKRLQKVMSDKGYNATYEDRLIAIEKIHLGVEPREKYKTLLVLEYAYSRLQEAGDKDEPVVTITGNDNALCGNTVKFEAEVTNADPSCWSLTWEKTRENVTESIDIKKENYKGSTDRTLVITSVSREDEWIYQAVLSRNTNGNNQKILSNKILLNTLGELPGFDVWKVTTDLDGITIQYAVEDIRPEVFNIKWTKNEKLLDFENTKYTGGSLENKCLKITSPTEADRGKYCCTITNAVGSSSMDITFDVPKATISTEPQSYFGSCASISSEVVSCPAPDGAQWQKSIDDVIFHDIDISKPKYHGSSLNPKSPKLEINLISFDDKHYYRLRVWNKVGEHVSNTFFLNVIGSLPNVTTSHKTCIENHSVTLIGMVFLYEKLPEIESVFWSKNGVKLNSQGMRMKYSEVSIDNPSLTIFDVNQHDAGSYQLTATNAVGSTQSDIIVLGIPDVLLEKCEKKEDGSRWFTVTTKSIPSPCFVQWSMIEKNSNSFKVIDVSVEDYKGTSNSLPHPVLVINHSEKLQTHYFQIEVQNFIGSCKKKIQDNTNPETPTADTKKSHSLGKLYSDQGRSVIFANLFDELAECFPEDKIQRLQDLIGNSGKVRDTDSLYQVIYARECFRILRDENLFTPEDLIYIQYLLKTTDCEELYTKCYEYARKQSSLCFYEMPTENGYNQVKFHVKGNLANYTKEQIETIRETVAALLRCTSRDIYISGLDHSTSFFVVISIKLVYLKNLLAMGKQDHEKLIKLKIDHFIVDFVTVYLRHPKGYSERLDSEQGSVFMESQYNDVKTSLTTLQRSKNMYEQPKIPLPTPDKLPKLKEMESLLETDSSSSQLCKNTEIHTASNKRSIFDIFHISCKTSDRLWISGVDGILETDETGTILKKLDVKEVFRGNHTVTNKGELLFLKENRVYKLTFCGDLQVLYTHFENACCIHSSQIDGDVLVGSSYSVTRYKETGGIVQKLQLYKKRDANNIMPIYITENINRDIIVSSWSTSKVVAVDKTGQHRFTYKLRSFEFRPMGICTDVLGQIIVCNNKTPEPNVHLLDVDGNFLSYLLRSTLGFRSRALCVDEKHNLYVGVNDRIDVYSYLTDAMLEEPDIASPKKETKAICIERRTIFQ